MRRVWTGLVLGLAVLFAGCGTTPSPALGDSPTIQGKVEGWVRGEGVLQAVGSDEGPVLGEGRIFADGGFYVRMYGETDLVDKGLLTNLRSREGPCTIEVSTGEVNLAMAVALYFPSGDVPIVLVDDSKSPTKVGILVYVDRDTGIRVAPNGGDCLFIADVHLRKGWNWAVIDKKTGQLEVRYPAGFVWMAEVIY